MSSISLADALENDIRLCHERFVQAMETRLPDMTPETKERYFVVLSALVGKLEVIEKPLRDILQEMMAEAATHILTELGQR